MLASDRAKPLSVFGREVVEPGNVVPLKVGPSRELKPLSLCHRTPPVNCTSCRIAARPETEYRRAHKLEGLCQTRVSPIEA